MIYVYKITSPNLKSYIGITRQKPKFRWNKHKNDRYPIGNAIRKYKDKMSYQILAIVEDWEYACYLEKGLIKSLNTKSPNGYNLTDGGDGTNGFKRSDESTKKIAESNRFDIDENLLIELYNSGVTRKELADVFGCCYETVSRRLRSLGKRRFIKEDLEKKVTKLINLGYKNKEIAEKLGCDYSYACKLVKRVSV